MNEESTRQPLWTPSPERVRAANITRFKDQVAKAWRVDLPDTDALYEFSIAEREKFWQSVRDFASVKAATWGSRVLVDGDKMPGAKWFPDARLNFAENLLRRRDDDDAIVFRGEDRVGRRLSFAQLYDRVSVLARALRAAGVGPGDRVAGYLPNMPEAIVAMLASVSLGATWSLCSPDFGVAGVLDRFGQIGPKILFASDGYRYNGKRHDTLGKLKEIAAALPTVVRVVVAPYGDQSVDARALAAAVPGAVTLEDFCRGFAPGEIEFAQLPFDHPLYILFSSGTTGVPKCIVHSAGGAILKHATEQPIHCDIRVNDRVFFFTTCGWMMWNWLAAALAWGATLLLYDGSPTYPGPEVLFDFAEVERATLFGTSAKFIDSLAKSGLQPIKTHRLATVRTLCSTGSPLAPEGFDFVYRAISKDVHLASISGGTDILGCFCGGDPTKPVWRGEIQARILGMAVEVFDDEGKPVRGRKGELVCTKPFPSMPLGFWGDQDGSRYKAAYFEAFPNVWTHGDYVEITEHGGLIIYGRSDATLNPGGVRIGTAEIYRQVEKLSEVREAIVVGQDWRNDVRVVLFVVLKEGLVLEPALAEKIKAQVRRNCTPRHVPAVIVQVADIPRTKSGKITELAVRDVIHGRAVKNVEALANPEALDLYKDLPQLKA
ncbi:MAG: acetoacetate--CoA ligase [Rhodospirillales bacterium]|nr:acetoacetate--CoA ligase [Rhodospirillales bacterium]